MVPLTQRHIWIFTQFIDVATITILNEAFLTPALPCHNSDELRWFSLTGWSKCRLFQY